jgi:transcriptional regulator with XRE-family HTH domain
MALKQKRLEAGLSQRALAEKSGVTIRAIQSYEQGWRDLRKASVGTVLALAKALDCTAEDILEEV